MTAFDSQNCLTRLIFSVEGMLLHVEVASKVAETKYFRSPIVGNQFFTVKEITSLCHLRIVYCYSCAASFQSIPVRPLAMTRYQTQVVK
jgi:hypothetical protein